MNESDLKVHLLPIEQVHPNPWNPNQVDPKMMRKLRRQIERNGFDDPIICRPHPELPGEWQIVDGFHRWTILKEMGATHIPATVGAYTDQQAKLKTINANYMRGNAVPIKLAALVHELNKELTLDDLEAALPFDRPELTDALELLKLPGDMDREAAANEEKERQAQPVFISATIYKDKKRGLYEFVEQAMLESEATFCEIRIKVECGEQDRDLVIEAMQNLQAVADRGQLGGEDAPVVVRFALFPDQFQVVDQALTHIVDQLGEGAKNPRGRALELLAADYLAGAG